MSAESPLAGAIDRALVHADTLDDDGLNIRHDLIRAAILAEIEAEFGSLTVEHKTFQRSVYPPARQHARLVSEWRAER